MVNILVFLWLIKAVKTVFLWLYLWQLKEYHRGRFIAHLKSISGRILVINPANIIKTLIILFYVISGPCFFYVTVCESYPYIVNYPSVNFLSFLTIVVAIYLLEAMRAIQGFANKSLKMPVWTGKTIFLFVVICAFVLALSLIIRWLSLTMSSLGVRVLSGEQFSVYLVIADLLLPFLISFIILGFQPITVVLRNRTIRQAALKRLKMSKLIVVGVTGSYGKTSTKEFLREILSTKFSVLATKEHQNSEIGIANCILNDLLPKHEIFIAEMGAYNRGGINFLCKMVKPQIGIITGANEQHLSTFGSIDNLLSAEGGIELLRFLPKNGLAVINLSSELINNRKKEYLKYNEKIKIKTCSAKEEADYWCDNLAVGADSLSFRVKTYDGIEEDFHANLLGRQNAENILLACAVSRELGMTLSEIGAALSRIKPEGGGIHHHLSRNGINIIDSTYSANPNGVIAHLEYLAVWPKKRILIMPSLIELGRATNKVHKNIGQMIASVCDIAIITTKDGFSSIKNGVDAVAESGAEIMQISNPQEIIGLLSERLREGDAVLLESRVPKEVINYLVSHDLSRGTK
ncbi:MAG: UDP-N-acetylmuramoyl-tripeptide--D-alanyl-D-alanine ligase [bacterium]